MLVEIRNGSFFAATHATTHYYRVWTSGQGFFRKSWLSILFLYNLIQVSRGVACRAFELTPRVQLIFQFVGLSSRSEEHTSELQSQ